MTRGYALDGSVDRTSDEAIPVASATNAAVSVGTRLPGSAPIR
jgi:hypothetical protein